MKTPLDNGFRKITLFIAGLLLNGCLPTGFGTGSSNTPELMPSSTTVGVNQSLSFQTSGGVTPYQYQVSGVGSVDSSGNYQAGPSPGTAQIQVTDSNGNSSSATVSVIQYSANNNSGYVNPSNILGPVVAVDSHAVDAQGDVIKSKFVKTSLPHPLVRVDQRIEGKNIMATRAIVEDQFVVTLNPGETESALNAILAKEGAHISRALPGPGAYLVSLNQKGSPPSSALSSDLLTKRSKLKWELETIASVSPNVITRAPASSSSIQP